MSPLDRLQTLSQTTLSDWRDRFPAHRPVGFYNAYVPEEMFHAAGLTPVYVFHKSVEGGQNRAHLPGFACWPSRSLLDQALAGELDDLAGMVFAQTCDTVQALTDIWRANVPHVPLYHVGVPSNMASSTARRYLVADLRHLSGILGGVSDDALRMAYTTYNRTRKLVNHLYERAADLQPTQLYAILRAGFLTPRDEYNRLLAQLLEGLPVTNTEGPRLILVGPHLAETTLFQILEQTGARVVDDVLDIGHRHFTVPIATAGDPFGALADRLLASLPTPTKYHPDRRRDADLVRRARLRQADGIVFARQKFCDPHGFDYANTRRILGEARIPHVLVELEQTPHVGQMRTRIEAFLETIAK